MSDLEKTKAPKSMPGLWSIQFLEGGKSTLESDSRKHLVSAFSCQKHKLGNGIHFLLPPLHLPENLEANSISPF